MQLWFDSDVPGIREQGDAFPLIADPSGKMIVGQFGSFIDGFLKDMMRPWKMAT